MEITKNNFVSARFCDNDRTQIEVFVKGDKEGEVFPYIIELDENHPDYKNLVSITTLPDIHAYTDKWCSEQRKRFKKEIPLGSCLVLGSIVYFIFINFELFNALLVI